MHMEASEEITNHSKGGNATQWTYRNPGESQRRCIDCGMYMNYKPGPDCAEPRHLVKYRNRRDAYAKRKMELSGTAIYREFFDKNRDRIIDAMKRLSRDGRINSIYNVLTRDQNLREGIEKIGRNSKALSKWLCRQPEIGIIRDEKMRIRFKLKEER